MKSKTAVGVNETTTTVILTRGEGNGWGSYAGIQNPTANTATIYVGFANVDLLTDGGIEVPPGEFWPISSSALSSTNIYAKSDAALTAQPVVVYG
jgi:hypothetical protein